MNIKDILCKVLSTIVETDRIITIAKRRAAVDQIFGQDYKISLCREILNQLEES